jgi:hypothetical protein
MVSTRLVSAVGVAALLAVACSSSTPVSPSSPCRDAGSGGDIIGTGFGGRPVSGFEVDRSSFPEGPLGFTIRVGERARVRVTAGRPVVSGGCGSYPVFTYMMWSWNWMEGRDSIDSPLTPRTGPVDVTVVVCRCGLFGEPYWTAAALPINGTPHWEQRASLDGPQTLELEVRGISPGSTSFFVVGFAGPPYTTTNPIQDNAIYQLQSVRVSVIP